jgi:hypothetical protein
MKVTIGMKILKYFLIIFFVLEHLGGQTYTVGDTVDNFSADYCVNEEGTWDYHTDGTGNVVWMNLFTSW